MTKVTQSVTQRSAGNHFRQRQATAVQHRVWRGSACAAGATGEEGEEDAAAGASGAATAAEMRALLAALPTCVTREQCDMLATNFVLVQTKGARKRMVRGGREVSVLFQVSAGCRCTICRKGLGILRYSLTLEVVGSVASLSLQISAPGCQTLTSAAVNCYSTCCQIFVGSGTEAILLLQA